MRVRSIGLVLAVAILASPAWAIYYSAFKEPVYQMNQNLVPQDGWVNSGTTTDSDMIWVDKWNDNGCVQINPWRTTRQDVEHALNASDPTGITTVDFDVIPGIGLGGNCWYLWVTDNADGQVAYWYGGINAAQCRIGGTVTAVPGGITTQTTLRSVVNAATGTTDYYYDKHDGNGMQFLKTYSGYAGTASDKVVLQAYGRGWIEDDDTWVFIDNLNIPEPTALLLLGLGGLLGLRRRRA